MRNPQSSATSNKKSAATKKTTAVSTTTSKPTPCCSKVGLKRGPWTPEEDELLVSYLAKEGEGRWRTLPKRAGLLRCGKSCRLRWMNYLRPSVKRGPISSDEEDLILRLHRLLGNRWSLIAGRIPGRTDNEIKNYWNTHLSKKLISQGIDPRTHKPLKPESSTVSDAKASSSSSKVNHNPNTNKPSPISSGLDQDTTSSDCQNQKEETHTGYLHPTNNVLEGLCQDSTILLPHGYAAANNFPCFEALTFRGYEDNLDACGDDIFSSFLNSLINEESAASQQQEKVINGAMPGSHFDPLLLISGSNYGGIGTSCKDTPAVMSSKFYHQDEHSNLRSSNDHI